MKFAVTPRLAASLAALALWALVVASALYWVWRVGAPPSAHAPLAGGGLEQTTDPRAVARALGAAGERTSSAGDMNGRFVLRGVVTHGPDAGAALLAVDGKPPKPVRVGAPVGDAGGWTVRAVTPRGAVLAGDAREVTLEVPRPDSRLDTHANAGLDSRGSVFTPPPVSGVPPPPGSRGPGLMAPRLLHAPPHP